MDQILLEKKIDSILRCLERINSRIPSTKEAFAQDLDAQDIIVLNISRTVQLSVDLAMHIYATTQLPTPETMGEAFERLREIHVLPPEVSEKMKKAVGFRNIAGHNYDEININITYTIAKEHTQDFIEYIKQIYTYLLPFD
ncbi:MAG: DUF86 domain-containing protein [Gammaproteobacteria bacterium]|nr:DUF86 domain-containing protein [Gammaproteobacteria bacterium]